MMKAILFGLVLAVTIPAGFFSPAPLDKLTMNLNIPDSPRGRQHGYPGYDAPWEDDYQPPNDRGVPSSGYTTATEVLKNIMQGVEELKEREKSGNLSREAMVGGDQCNLGQIFTCDLSLPGKLATCVLEFQAEGPIAIHNCVKEVATSECKPCICYFFELIAQLFRSETLGLPCPNLEFGEEEDVVTDPTMTTPGHLRAVRPPPSVREKAKLDKMMKEVEELKEREKSGNLSPEAMLGGDQCNALQIFTCGVSLPGKVAKCAVEFEKQGPIAILNCVKEVAKSECKPCICYFIEMIGLPCPDLEFVKKKMTKGVEELKEREKSGNLSPKAMVGGTQCDLAQIVICDVTLPGKVALCFIEIIKGPEAFVNCIREKATSECKPCICYFIELFGQPCPLGEEEEGEEHDEEGYVGCYDNELKPKIYGNQTISLIQHNSRDRCSKECQQKYPKTTFIGLETGYMCHCGLTEPKFSHRNQPVADYKCNLNRCPGDRHGKCGGHNYIKIFQI